MPLVLGNRKQQEIILIPQEYNLSLKTGKQEANTMDKVTGTSLKHDFFILHIFSRKKRDFVTNVSGQNGDL